MSTEALLKLFYLKFKSSKIANIFLGVFFSFNMILLTSIVSYYRTIYKQTEAFGQKQSISIWTELSILGIIVVFTCIVTYNILLIWLEGQENFFEKVNALEKKKTKIFVILFLYLSLLNSVGSIVGWLIGEKLGDFIAISTLPFETISIKEPVGITEASIAFSLNFISFCIGVIGPLSKILNLKMKTAEEKNEEYFEERKKIKKVLGCPAIINLSIANLIRYDKRIIASIALLVLGFTLVNTTYIQYKSYDYDKYLEQRLVSDVEIVNKNGQEMESKNIFLEILDTKNQGKLLSKKMNIEMPEEIYNQFFSFYDSDLLKQMEDNESWTEEYKQIKQTRKCKVTVYSLDDMLIDKMVESCEIYLGAIDKEMLKNDNYVIAQGISSDKEKQRQPFLAGDNISLYGRDFTIMAIVDLPITFTELSWGENFGISFYMSENNFNKLFPKSKLEKIYLDVPEEQMVDIENTLKKIDKDNSNMQIKTEKNIFSDYQREVKDSIFLKAIIAFLLLTIGIICMAHSMIDSIYKRKKEFSLMNIIGASYYQIRKILICEGAIFSGITCILTYFVNFIVGTIAAKMYAESFWSGQYFFSLLPINTLIIPFIIICLLIPIIVFERIRKTI